MLLLMLLVKIPPNNSYSDFKTNSTEFHSKELLLIFVNERIVSFNVWII